jgi:hypothetical protein
MRFGIAVLLALLINHSDFATLTALAEAGEAVPTVPSEGTSNLVVGQAEQFVLDVSQGGVLNISGDIFNSGTLYAISTNPAVTTASISAENIYNFAGATISTVLPQSLAAHYEYFVPNLSLSLTARNNLVNAGTIASAGNLNLAAGGSITNSLPGDLSQIAATTAVMQAIQNVNIMASSIVNNGTIVSQLANINITNSLPVADMLASSSAPTNSAISILNTNGTIAALSGVINVNEPGFAAKEDLSIKGGELAAKEININSGDGNVKLAVDDIQGFVNIHGGTLSLITGSAGGLNLGTVELTGDPLIANMSGDILVNTNLIFPGVPLALIANGNIYSGGDDARKIIAGELSLIAGAKLELQWDGVYAVTGATPAGGQIDLTRGGGISEITSSGQVLILALPGAGSDSGKIKIDTPINAGAGVYIGGGKEINIADINVSGAPTIGQSIRTITVEGSSNWVWQLGLDRGVRLYFQDGHLLPSYGYNSVVDFNHNSACCMPLDPGNSANILIGSIAVSGDYPYNLNIAGRNVSVGSLIGNATANLSSSGPDPFLIGDELTINGVRGQVNLHGQQQYWTGSGYVTQDFGRDLRIQAAGGITITNKADVVLAGANSTGSLNLTATNGAYSGPSTRGDIVIDNANLSARAMWITGKSIIFGNSSLAGPDYFYIDASGNLSLDNANITSKTISISTTGSITSSGSSASVLSGTTISLSASSAGSATIGSGAGQISLNASESITLYLPTEDIVLDASGLGASALNLGGKSVTLTGTPTLNGLSIFSKSTAPFTFGKSPGCTNCADASVSKYLSISSTGDLTVNRSIPALTGTMNFNSETGNVSFGTQVTDLSAQQGIWISASKGSITFSNTPATLSSLNTATEPWAYYNGISMHAQDNISLGGVQSISTNGSTGLSLSADNIDLGELNSVVGISPAVETYQPSPSITINATTSLSLGNLSNLNTDSGSITISGSQLVVTSPLNVTCNGCTFTMKTGGSSLDFSDSTKFGTFSGMSAVTVAAASLVLSPGDFSGARLDLQLTQTSPIDLTAFGGRALSVTSNGDILLPTSIIGDAPIREFDGGSSGKFFAFEGAGNPITIVSKAGTVRFTGPTTITSNGANGGVVIITGKYVDTGSNTVSVTANGTYAAGAPTDPKYEQGTIVAGYGGQIRISTTAADADLAIDAQGFRLETRYDPDLFTGSLPEFVGSSDYEHLNETGVYVSAGQDLVVDPQFVRSDLNISLTAGRNLKIDGDLTVPSRAIQMGEPEYPYTITQFGSIVLNSGSGLEPYTPGCLSCINGMIRGADQEPQPIYFGSYTQSGIIELRVDGDLTNPGAFLDAKHSFVSMIVNGDVVADSIVISYPADQNNYYSYGSFSITARDLRPQSSGPVALTAGGYAGLSLEGDITNNIIFQARGVSLVSRLGSVDLNVSGEYVGASAAGSIKLNIVGTAPISIGIGNFETSSATRTFTVGGKFAGSGVAGNVSSIQNLQISGPWAAPGMGEDLNLTINQGVKLNALYFTNWRDISITGGWDGARSGPGNSSQIGGGSINSLNVNMPNLQNTRIEFTGLRSDANISVGSGNILYLVSTLGSINATATGPIQINNLQASPSGKVQLTSPQILVTNTAKISGSSITITSPFMTNNGGIGGTNTNIFLNSPSDLIINGTGFLIGNIVFNAANNVNIFQNGIVGNVAGFAGGKVSIISGTTLGTNGIQFNNAVTATALSRETVFALGGGKLTQGLANNLISAPSSSVIATDSQRRSISTGSDSGDEKGVKGSKLIVANSTTALSIYVANDDSMVIAEEGTEVSEEEDGELFLHHGKVVINATAQERQFKTAQGTVTVAKNSTAVVKVGRTSSLSAVSLQGQSRVELGGEPAVVVELGTGDVLVDKPATADFEDEMVAVDGVPPGEFITAGIERRGGRQTKTTHVSVREIVSKDIMINGSLVHVSGAKSKQHRAYLRNLQKASKEGDQNIRPIAYFQPVMLRERAVVHVNEPTNLQPGQSALFVFDKATLVRTPLGVLNFTPGSVVFARHSKDAQDLHVFNIHGSGALRCGAQTCFKSSIPGEEIVFSRGANPRFDDGLARRNVKRLGKHGETAVVSTECSIISLLCSDQTVQRALSNNLKLKERVLKNCAAVQMAIKRGPYRTSNVGSKE